MPGFFTRYANDRILDLIFGRTLFDPPEVLYAGLSLAGANRSGVVAEPVGGGYARVAVGNDLVSFTEAERGAKSNAAVIRFPPPEADWGLIQSLFLADAAEGGNVLAMTDLSTRRIVSKGGPAAKVPIGAMNFLHR